MLLEESVWIKTTIGKYFKAKNFPLLNIGSSTGHFRKKTQPHIHEHVFAPIELQGNQVIHLDVKEAEGVDIVGDLDDHVFRSKLRELGVKSVICSNLLEHLASPKLICNSILEVLPKGGLIIITVPYLFPFHKDPIDTLLRPNVKELHAFFPGTRLITSQIVSSEASYKKDLLRNRKYLLIMLARLCLPFYRPTEWRYIVKDFLNAGRKYSATCILVEK